MLTGLCLFIDGLISFGSFRRMRTVLFGIEDVAALMIASVVLFAISLKSPFKNMRFQSVSCSNCLYLL